LIEPQRRRGAKNDYEKSQTVLSKHLLGTFYISMFFRLNCRDKLFAGLRSIRHFCARQTKAQNMPNAGQAARMTNEASNPRF
jgi:hypothetical protein